MDIPDSPGSNPLSDMCETAADYSFDADYPEEENSLDEVLNNSLAIEADLSKMSNCSEDSGINDMLCHDELEEEEMNKSLTNILATNKNFFDIFNLNNLMDSL